MPRPLPMFTRYIKRAAARQMPPDAPSSALCAVAALPNIARGYARPDAHHAIDAAALPLMPAFFAC